MTHLLHRCTQILLVVLIVVGSTTAIIQATTLHRILSTDRENAQTTMAADTRAAARSLDAKLEAMRAAADRLAADITAHRPSDENVRAELMRLHTSLGLFGAGVKYAPFAFDPQRRLYAPYVMPGPDGAPMFRQIDHDYDYADGTRHWYDDPMRHGAMWVTPYWGITSRAMLAEYCAPFSRDGKRIGIVELNYSIAELRHHISELHIGRTGYVVVSTTDGRLLYHPQGDLVQAGMDIAQASKNGRDPLLAMLANDANAPLGHVTVVTHPISGQECWLVHERIPATGWSFDVLVFSDDLAQDQSALRRAWVLAIIGGTCALIGFSLLVFWHRPQAFHAWRPALISSVVLVMGTMALWWLMSASAWREGDDGTRIVDRSALDAYRGAFTADCAGWHMQPPIYLSTGVSIQSLVCEDSAPIRMSGIIWQKRPRTSDGGPTAGVHCPDASDFTLTPLYETTSGDTITTGWRFAATLRFNADYRRFPFDRQNLALRLCHPDLARNIILVPDLDGYDLLTPTRRPGIASDLDLPAWDMAEAFFSFRTRASTANLGLPASVPHDAVPNLQFNLVVVRRLMNPVIINGLPLLVVIFLSFILMLMITIDRQRADAFGYKTAAIMNTSGALFLVVVFQHVNLRRTLGSGAINYLEYCYFLVYVAFAVLALSSFLVARGMPSRHPLIADNRLAQLLYWPVLAGLLFTITAIITYRG